MAAVKWGTLETPHLALSVTTALANNGRQLGEAITPSGYIYSAYMFESKYHVAPDANASVELFALPAVNGSTYADGNAGVEPPINTLIGVFPVYGLANSGQVAVLTNIPTVPFPFKPLIKNRTGQTIPASSGTLTIRLYNEAVE